ncbi:hypothetical protein [Microvirga sp. TS319]|uniref:hypothetical protein n=1 Tax=Microvirga sp. TS319 TaxID=3241165 RepID=UPI00351A8FB8
MSDAAFGRILPVACVLHASVLALVLWFACASAQAGEGGRPTIVEDLEKGYGGFFVFTTADGRNYDIFQRIESSQGLSADANIVCMMNECLLEIAAMPQSAVARYSDETSNIGGLRRRLSGIRDAYSAMRMASPDNRPATIDAWHESLMRLTLCLKTAEECR